MLDRDLITTIAEYKILADGGFDGVLGAADATCGYCLMIPAPAKGDRIPAQIRCIVTVYYESTLNEAVRDCLNYIQPGLADRFLTQQP